MFSSKNDSPTMAKEPVATPHTTPSSASQNAIAFGTKIVGTVSTDNDIRLDGEIEGNVTSQNKVTLGQTGVVRGNISCASAEINGRIDGNINCTGQLTLRSTAIVKGDICIKTLCIEPGAQFEGTCKMNSQA